MRCLSIYMFFLASVSKRANTQDTCASVDGCSPIESVSECTKSAMLLNLGNVNDMGGVTQENTADARAGCYVNRDGQVRFNDFFNPNSDYSDDESNAICYCYNDDSDNGMF